MNAQKKKKRIQALCLAAAVLVLWNLIQMLGSGPEKIRIACVGDSITYGAGLEHREEECYPVKLQEFLGTERYQVGNFGTNGATVGAFAQHTYTEQERYQQSLDYQAEYVILMLGTNDARWEYEGNIHDFSRCYRELAERYAESGSNVILMTPPAVCPPADPDFMNVEYLEEIVRSIRELGKELRLEVVDIYQITEERTEFFQEDGLHLNAMGAETAAREVSGILNNMRKDP